MYSDQVTAMDELKPLSASAFEPLEQLKAEEETGKSVACLIHHSNIDRLRMMTSTYHTIPFRAVCMPVGAASVEELDEEAKAEQGPMKEVIMTLDCVLFTRRPRP